MAKRKAPLSKPMRDARDIARVLRARGPHKYNEADPRASVVELLTALRHYCATFDVDVSGVYAISYVHWRAEHDAANKPESDGITDV